MTTKTLYEDYEFTIKNHYYSATATLNNINKMIMIHCYDQCEYMNSSGNPDIAVDEYEWDINLSDLQLELSTDEGDIETEAYIECLAEIRRVFINEK